MARVQWGHEAQSDGRPSTRAKRQQFELHALHTKRLETMRSRERRRNSIF